MILGFISRYKRVQIPKADEGKEARGFSQAQIDSCPAVLQLLLLIGVFDVTLHL